MGLPRQSQSTRVVRGEEDGEGIGGKEGGRVMGRGGRG